MLGLRLDEETDAQLLKLARRQGRTKSDVARDALREYLRREAHNEKLIAEVRSIARATRAADLDYLDAINDDLVELIEAEEKAALSGPPL